MSKTKAFPIALFFAFFFGQAAAAYDFSLGVLGPQHVVRAHSIFLWIEAELLEGPRTYIYYSVSGPPAGSVVSYPLLDEGCCGGNRGWEPKNTLLRIDIPAGAAVGTYPIVISAESGGVTRQTSHTLRVDPLPGPLPRIEASAPPIPSLAFAEWQANMVSYGADMCDEETINSHGTWEGGVWYYDGIRVYYQIADYTGDASWETCAGYVKNIYRPYVLNTILAGWRVFPHGLYEDHLRTGETASRDAVVRLAEYSTYARAGGAVNPNRVRETAYILNAYRIAKLAGEDEHRNFQRAVAFLLGHFDQWFVSRTETYMQPFMVGLACEALIQYYEETGDPRVPPAIKNALDELWDWAWVSVDKAFFYSTGNTSSGAPDLNLLIAPAFAWLYSQTGDPLYQQRADLVFEGGVEGAFLGQGKQFSQNYRWSFDFVEWRLYPNGRLVFNDDFESGDTGAWD